MLLAVVSAWGHPQAPARQAQWDRPPNEGGASPSAMVGLAVLQEPRIQAQSGLVTARVLIVDDHQGFRESARLLLEAARYEVVGEAHDGRTGVLEAERLGPEIVLLDVFLPDRNGFEVAAELTARGLAVVVLTSSRDGRDFGPLVAESGARGFIPKTELSGESLAAVLQT